MIADGKGPGNVVYQSIADRETNCKKAEVLARKKLVKEIVRLIIVSFSETAIYFRELDSVACLLFFFSWATTTRFQGLSSLPPLSFRKETLVAAGHVAPKIWELFQMCIWGGVAVYAIIRHDDHLNV